MEQADQSVPLGDEALICAFEIPRQGPVRAVPTAGIRAALASTESVTWVHFRLSDARTGRYLLESDLLPAVLQRRLAEHDLHSLLEADERGLTVVMTDLPFELSAEAPQACGLWAYATAHSLVSARTHALHSADALRLAVRDGLRPASGVELVAELFDRRNDALRQIANQLADDVNEVEDDILRGAIRERRERLGLVRRRCAHIRRHFAPDRNALQRLLARPPAWLEARTAERLRASADELSHLIDDASELYERAKLLQEELAARLAEKTGDRLYVLSVLSAVLLPMTLVTGVFGMNVAGLPGLEGASSFFWTMLLVFGSGALTVGVLRWSKLL